jgi:hypothetical protein
MSGVIKATANAGQEAAPSVIDAGRVAALPGEGRSRSSSVGLAAFIAESTGATTLLFAARDDGPTLVATRLRGSLPHGLLDGRELKSTLAAALASGQPGRPQIRPGGSPGLGHAGEGGGESRRGAPRETLAL